VSYSCRSVSCCPAPDGCVSYSCVLVSFSVVLCPAPTVSVSHQCRLVSFRVAVRPGPASVQCPFVRNSSKQCLWCPLMHPGPRRHMQSELASASCNITPQALDVLKRAAECTMYAEQCMNTLYMYGSCECLQTSVVGYFKSD